MSANGVSQDAQGRWFYMDRFGQKNYTTTTADRPSNSLLHSYDFNPRTGQWESKTNWGNVIGLMAGGAALAPAAVAGLGALAGSGAAAGGAATGGVPLMAGTIPAGFEASMGAAPTAGAGMAKFGLGSLAHFFNSNGGSNAINAAGQLIGGKMQSGANNHAADLQAKAAQQALDFAKQQYADAVKNYAPFLQASQSAVPQLTDFVNQTRPPQGGYPVNGSMVTMRAPTGQMKQVPAQDVPHYEGLGATRMG